MCQDFFFFAIIGTLYKANFVVFFLLKNAVGFYLNCVPGFQLQVNSIAISTLLSVVLLISVWPFLKPKQRRRSSSSCKPDGQLRDNVHRRLKFKPQKSKNFFEIFSL